MAQEKWEGFGFFRKYKRLLKQAKFKVPAEVWVLVSTAMAIVIAVLSLSMIILLELPISELVSLVVFMVVIDLTLGYPYLLASRRINAIEESLPDPLVRVPLFKSDSLSAGEISTTNMIITPARKRILLNIIGAIIIVVIGIFLGRFLGKASRHVIETLSVKKQLKKSGISFEPEVFAENVIKYIIYIAAFIAALNYLGVTPVILNIIFAGLIIVIILTIFLAFIFF